MTKKLESLSDILANISDHNTPHAALAFAPKRFHDTVEEELQEITDTIAIQEVVGESSTSIVADHFIQQAENIAKAMEKQAELCRTRADHYDKLAMDARKSGQIQAKDAAAHEARMKDIESLLVKQDV